MRSRGGGIMGRIWHCEAMGWNFGRLGDVVVVWIFAEARMSDGGSAAYPLYSSQDT